MITERSKINIYIFVGITKANTNYYNLAAVFTKDEHK